MIRQKHYIYGVHITERMKCAVDVQKVLTEYGCNIKTRLGLHEISDDASIDRGLLILELCGDEGKIEAMTMALREIEGVEVKGMIFDHPH